MFKTLMFSQNKDIERQLTLSLLALMFLLLAPFSIYRLLTGDVIQFVVDAVMSMIAAFVFIQTWRRKKSKTLNTISVFSFLSVITVLIHFKGMSMIYWTFPAMIGTYFLLASTPAVIANIIFMGSITLLLSLSGNLTVHQVTSIYPSLILVCLFGFILSKRSESQNKRLCKLVSEDTLTGVKNRRSFDEKVAAILLNQNRVKTPVSMLILDIDFFKNINDSYGHKQGDQVLIDFAEKVKSIIRTTDYVYRFGGEEFVVIAYNSSLDNSGGLADSIREFISQTPSLAKYNITVSIGVSEILENDDADSWFRRADRALYEAKDTGRNRVCLAKVNGSQKDCSESIIQYRKTVPLPESDHELSRPKNNLVNVTDNVAYAGNSAKSSAKNSAKNVASNAANSSTDVHQGVQQGINLK